MCDSSVLDPHSNLMNSQEQTGVGVSSDTFTLHLFVSHRHAVRLENQHSGHRQFNLKSLLVDESRRWEQEGQGTTLSQAHPKPQKDPDSSHKSFPLNAD